MLVNIKQGVHRGVPVSGTFELMAPYAETRTGAHITIRLREIVEPFKVPTPRIKIMSTDDFEYMDSEGNVVSAPAVSIQSGSTQLAMNTEEQAIEEEFIRNETEEEAFARIKHAFDMLDRATHAVTAGVITGLIVSGPPGIGKSFGVEQIMSKHSVNGTIYESANVTCIKGRISPLHLYRTLYEYSDAGATVILDDADGILFEEEGLNLLKAALDSRENRVLHWSTESKFLSENDIPNHFEFKGSIIFLTNVNFETMRDSRIKTHLNAIMSRCHYMDLGLNRQRDLILRIKQIVRDGMLSRYGFEEGEEKMIVSYIENNLDSIREVSLRMVKKIADLVKADPEGWLDFADATCMKREAKFKRMLKERANS